MKNARNVASPGELPSPNTAGEEITPSVTATRVAGQEEQEAGRKRSSQATLHLPGYEVFEELGRGGWASSTRPASSRRHVWWRLR